LSVEHWALFLAKNEKQYPTRNVQCKTLKSVIPINFPAKLVDFSGKKLLLH